MQKENRIFNLDWLEFDWTNWVSLHPDDNEASALPTDPGLYRVRHQAYDGLVYLGETGRSVRGRIRALARGIHDGEMPFSDPHTGSPCLWAVVDRHGPGFEVSATTPDKATERYQRKAIEDALIALHRRETGLTPVGNFGRMPPGYEKSKQRSADVRGGPVDQRDARNFEESIEPLPWQNAESLTSQDWMGLSWTVPRPLPEASSGLPAESGLYRIWDADSAPPLEYIGESVNLHSRLNSHRRNRPSELRFSYTKTPQMQGGFERSQAETDLLGAHWLACEQPPQDQY